MWNETVAEEGRGFMTAWRKYKKVAASMFASRKET